MPKNKIKCPKCNAGLLDTRVKRSFFVKRILFFLPIKRYKCNKCSQKVYIYGQPKFSEADFTSV